MNLFVKYIYSLMFLIAISICIVDLIKGKFPYVFLSLIAITLIFALTYIK